MVKASGARKNIEDLRLSMVNKGGMRHITWCIPLSIN